MSTTNHENLGRTIEEYERKSKECEDIISKLRELRTRLSFVNETISSGVDITNVGVGARNALIYLNTLGEGDVLRTLLNNLNDCSQERNNLLQTLKQLGYGHLAK